MASTVSMTPRFPLRHQPHWWEDKRRPRHPAGPAWRTARKFRDPEADPTTRGETAAEDFWWPEIKSCGIWKCWNWWFFVGCWLWIRFSWALSDHETQTVPFVSRGTRKSAQVDKPVCQGPTPSLVPKGATRKDYLVVFATQSDIFGSNIAHLRLKLYMFLSNTQRLSSSQNVFAANIVCSFILVSPVPVLLARRTPKCPRPALCSFRLFSTACCSFRSKTLKSWMLMSGIVWRLGINTTRLGKVRLWKPHVDFSQTMQNQCNSMNKKWQPSLVRSLFRVAIKVPVNPLAESSQFSHWNSHPLGSKPLNSALFWQEWHHRTSRRKMNMDFSTGVKQVVRNCGCCSNRDIHTFSEMSATIRFMFNVKMGCLRLAMSKIDL